MTWFAIRTTPGAQRQHRFNVAVSEVEQALTDAGFTHYMPAEYRVIRDRRKTRTYVVRRYPLLKGYVFVTSCSGVRDVDGVAAVVGSDESPYPVNIVDILKLRTIEAKSEDEAERDLRKVISAEEADARKTFNKSLSAARRKLNDGARVRVLWGSAVGREATLAGWADDRHVRAILADLDGAGEVLVPFDAVRLVAA